MSTSHRIPSREPQLRAQQHFLERRRLTAADLFAQGLTTDAVALRLNAPAAFGVRVGGGARLARA